MWDLNSLIRDRICTPCIGRRRLNYCTAREAPTLCFCVRGFLCLECPDLPNPLGEVLPLLQFSRRAGSDFETLEPGSPTQTVLPFPRAWNPVAWGWAGVGAGEWGRGRRVTFSQVTPAQINSSKFLKNRAASFCAFR